ncbi:NUDIX domain-containing protein [Methanosarcina sp. KYL-1]|nr:NUDIX domain-containing protein [Methanosarcina sp. KYL-1]
MVTEVDENDNFIGLRPREDFYTGKHIHRASHLILLDSRNRMLLQKRALSKLWYPGRCTFSVSGTVNDESYEDCLKREMLEEIGISVPFRELFRLPCILNGKGGFHMVYLGACSDQNASMIRHDPEEASSVEWVGLEELRYSIEEKPENYAPALRAAVRRFFEEGCLRYII